MRRVGAFHLRRADRLHELLAVVREPVDHLHVVVDDPHVFLRIVRADVDRVRAPQQLVPLIPRLDDVAVGVRDDDAVFPLRVDAQRAVRRALDPDGVVFAFPGRHPFSGVLIGAADSGKRGARRIAPQAGHREADAGPELRQQDVPRRRHLRELAAEEHEHAIRALREHALPRAVRPLLVAGQRADVFGPALHDFVRAREVFAADRARHGRVAGARGRTLSGSAVAVHPHSKASPEAEDDERRNNFTHRSLPAAVCHERGCFQSGFGV